MAARKTSAEDLADALQALQKNNSDSGFAKYASGIIVSILLALILWVGGTLLSLNNTVTRMSANVDQVGKSIGALQAQAGSSQKVIGDLQAGLAAANARQAAFDSDNMRTKERIRILEGQKPLGHDD